MRKPLASWCVRTWTLLALAALPALAAEPEAAPPGEAPAAETEAAAPREAGLVVALQGEATAALPGRERRGLELKSPVYAGDEIRTKSKSRVQLCFKDQTTVTLGQKARLVIDEFVYSPGDAAGKVETTLDVGAFKVLGGAVSKLGQDRVTVRTPTATIGIRGTLVMGEESEKGLTVVFLGGRGVAVWNRRGAVLLRGLPGVGVEVKRPARPEAPPPPPPPRRIPPPEIRVLEGKVAIGMGRAALTPILRRPPEEPAPPPEQPVLLRRLSSLAPGEEGKEEEDKEEPPLRKPPPPPLLRTPMDAILAETAAASQEAVEKSLGDVTFLGDFVAALTDDSFATRTNDRLWYGPVTAFNMDGVIKGRAAAGGDEIPFALPAVPANPGGLYTGATENLIADSLVLRGAPRALETRYAYDNLGEFAFFLRDTPAPFADGGAMYEYRSAAYAGIPSLKTPTAGVFYYGAVEEDQSPGLAASGGYGMAIDDLVMPTLRGEAAEFGVGVNFRNRRVIGLFAGDPGEANFQDFFFYGTVDGEGKIDAVCLGQAYERTPGDWEVWDGSVHGGLFGSRQQGVGLGGTGAAWSVNSGSRYLDWAASGGAFKINDDSRATSPAGTRALVGWATGVALDIGGGATLPYFTYSATETDVSITANADTGMLAGTFKTGQGTLLTDLLVGGSTLSDSAYVDEQLFAARISGGAAAINVDAGYTGPLESASNFLLALPETGNEGAPWVAMGEWEIRFDHPMNGTKHLTARHLSYFVVGQKTPAAYVNDLIANSVTGTYLGPSRATYMTGGSVTQLDGSVSLNIDFGAQTFGGGLTFPGHTLTVSGGLDSGGLTGGTVTAFDGQGPATQTFTGTFYGPQAQSVGGNFHAYLVGSGERILGVYVGHKQ